MNIGIIGSGNIGGTLARLLTSAGHSVAISNRRGPESLRAFVDSLGANCKAVTPEDAVLGSDLIILAIPWTARQSLPGPEIFAGKVVVDACNPYVGSGQVEDLQEKPSSSVLRSQLEPKALVKAFNTIYYRDLAEHGDVAVPNSKRQVIFVSGDEAEAKKAVADLIANIGFAAYDLGSIAESRVLQEPGGKFYNRHLTLPDVEAA